MRPCVFDEVEKLQEEMVHKVNASKVVLKFLEKKIALEEEYANQVRQLCKQQPDLGSSGTAGCFSILVGLVCDQASTTLNNLASFTTDAVNPLKAALLQLKSDFNEACAEGKKLQQERKKNVDNYKKAKIIYESIVQDCTPDKATTAESEFKSHITVVNNNQNSYFQDHLPKIIKQFQTFEALRSTKTHDGIQKFISYLSTNSAKCCELTKASADKIHKPSYASSVDTDKFRKLCDDLAHSPAMLQFEGYDKNNSALSPTSQSLRNMIIRHSKNASTKWRNSFTAITSPNNKDHKEPKDKKMKRQSMPTKSVVHMFGTPLQVLLEHQKKTYPDLDVPYVAYYLVNHFKKIGGMRCENVFRVPGMTVEVQSIKGALEAGEFSEDLLFCSVYSTASAFTMWLRELPTPLIPYYMHSHCLGAKTGEEILKIFYGLPTAHANMLVFLLGFIKELASNHDETHMDVDNLSMVFTPSILRSQNAADSLVNIERERQFVKSAIDASDLLSDNFTVNLNVREGLLDLRTSNF